jgi:hypothetical protein
MRRYIRAFARTKTSGKVVTFTAVIASGQATKSLFDYQKQKPKLILSLKYP